MKREEETMPRRQFLHQLDEALHRGCDTPGCAHEHGAEIFLTPRCHPGAGVRVEVLDDSGASVCRRAGAALLEVSHTGGPCRLDDARRRHPVCRHGRALDVLYSGGTDGELPTLPRGVGDADGGAPGRHKHESLLRFISESTCGWWRLSEMLEAGGNTLPTPHQAAIFLLEPGKRPLGLESGHHFF